MHIRRRGVRHRAPPDVSVRGPSIHRRHSLSSTLNRISTEHRVSAYQQHLTQSQHLSAAPAVLAAAAGSRLAAQPGPAFVVMSRSQITSVSPTNRACWKKHRRRPR